MPWKTGAAGRGTGKPTFDGAREMVLTESKDAQLDSSRCLLLVDLCGTLYDSNTTYDFLHKYLADDPEYRRFESKIRSLTYRLANFALPGDIRRTRAVSFLKGHSRPVLLAAAKEFLAGTAPIADVRQRVAQLAPNHDRTVLVSSSLDFIVEAARDILDFDDFHGAQLRYSGDTCEGEFEDDLLGAKHHLIAREFAHDRCTFITDNADDAACRGLVNCLIGVASVDDKRAISFWRRNADELLSYTS